MKRLTFALCLFISTISAFADNSTMSQWKISRTSLFELVKSGYNIVLTKSLTAAIVAKDCNAVDSQSGFYVTAIPVQVGSTGQRAFSSTAAGTIYFLATGVAPPETGGTPIQ